MNTDISETIIALEKRALEKWNQGDPSGYLDLSAEDATYFDPSLERRLNGLDSLKKYYEPIKGQINVSKYEMLNPKVTAVNNIKKSYIYCANNTLCIILQRHLWK